MVRNHLVKKLVVVILCGFIWLCNLPGCTPSNYKKDADEKVYNIIDQKWKKEFGTKANYKISDTVPSPNDIQIEKTIPVSGILTLPQAVAIATAHNREYQTQKEALYIKALDLGLTRHQFETQFFGMPGGEYAHAANEEFVGVGAGIDARINPDRLGQRLPEDPGRLGITNGFGFNQLLSTGTRIGTNVAIAWGRILTGTAKGEKLLSVLSVEVMQPLLRGSDQTVVLENLTQAERDALYQIRSFNKFRKAFVVSVITQYYRVLVLFDAVKNAQRNYNTLDWLQDKVGKLADAGRLPKIELDRVRQPSLMPGVRFMSLLMGSGLN
ncbi:MAG: hypothetical protein NTX52_08320 [Planctomycetota bacterium]|nr:hypothetical protein [Planctomycetota bacterium]